MSEIIRLDKMFSNLGLASRKEIKDYAKKGRIYVNNILVKKTDIKIDTSKDLVEFDGKTIEYNKYRYFMLNKPFGVVSATNDNVHKTVIDLITEDNTSDLFPVGRLDIDTVGLLLITNDGQLAHNLLAPSKHISKTYYAKIQGNLLREHIEIFEKGITLSDGTQTKPSKLVIKNIGEISEVELTIYEGKFHQVKRMFQAIECRVIYLKRIAMGEIYLDNELQEGCYRILNNDELQLLKCYGGKING